MQWEETVEKALSRVSHETGLPKRTRECERRAVESDAFDAARDAKTVVRSRCYDEPESHRAESLREGPLESAAALSWRRSEMLSAAQNVPPLQQTLSNVCDSDARDSA